MNSIIKNYYPVFQEYQALRSQLMDLLDDSDLRFQLPGNLTLGALCKEIGEVQHSYIESFKTFKQDFSYRNPASELAESVDQLKTWYRTLDAELRAAVETLSEEDIQNRVIERGFSLPPNIQLDVYKEALLIFYGKASVYLKAMGKTLPEQWVNWIA